jgi:hypothetical protein
MMVQPLDKYNHLNPIQLEPFRCIPCRRSEEVPFAGAGTKSWLPKMPGLEREVNNVRS